VNFIAAKAVGRLYFTYLPPPPPAPHEPRVEWAKGWGGGGCCTCIEDIKALHSLYWALSEATGGRFTHTHLWTDLKYFKKSVQEDFLELTSFFKKDLKLTVTCDLITTFCIRTTIFSFVWVIVNLIEWLQNEEKPTCMCPHLRLRIFKQNFFYPKKFCRYFFVHTGV
jgi:hypothetical protein